MNTTLSRLLEIKKYDDAKAIVSLLGDDEILEAVAKVNGLKKFTLSGEFALLLSEPKKMDCLWQVCQAALNAGQLAECWELVKKLDALQHQSWADNIISRAVDAGDIELIKKIKTEIHSDAPLTLEQLQGMYVLRMKEYDGYFMQNSNRNHHIDAIKIEFYALIAITDAMPEPQRKAKLTELLEVCPLRYSLPIENSLEFGRAILDFFSVGGKIELLRTVRDKWIFSGHVAEFKQLAGDYFSMTYTQEDLRELYAKAITDKDYGKRQSAGDIALLMDEPAKTDCILTILNGGIVNYLTREMIVLASGLAEPWRKAWLEILLHTRWQINLTKEQEAELKQLLAVNNTPVLTS